MLKAIQFLKDYKLLLTAVLTVVGTVLGVRFTIKQEPVDKPEVIVIIPSEDVPPDVVQGAGDRRGLILALARAKAGRLYAKETGLSPSEGVGLAKIVPLANIEAEMRNSGLKFETAPIGGPLTNLLDWLKANPEFLDQLVKIILYLIPLFA